MTACWPSLFRTIVFTAGAFLTLAGATAQTPWPDPAAKTAGHPPQAGAASLGRDGYGRPIPGSKEAEQERTAQNLRLIAAQERMQAEARRQAAAQSSGGPEPKKASGAVTQRHVEYTYDADGNLITETDASGVRRYTYDAYDHLMKVEQPGQQPVTYDYQSDGLRIAKHQGNTETRYQYDQRSLIAETNAIGNTIARYYYSATQLLSRTQVGSTPVHVEYFLDALQNPVVTMSQGVITSRTLYGAWGEIIAQQDANGVVTHPSTDGTHVELPNADQQPIGFTGYYKDTETGLYYAKARYYDPRVGRFTTQDPQEGNPMQPPSLQRYLYAYANPTVNSDPSGRVTEGLLNKELSDLASGKISKEEFRERTQARGVGALVGLATAPFIPLAGDAIALGGAVMADTVATGSLWTGLTLNTAGLSTTGVAAVEATAAITTGTMAPSVLSPINATGALAAERAEAQIAISLERATVTTVKTEARLASANAYSSVSQGLRPPESPHYTVIFRARLEEGLHYPGRSAQAHFQERNRQLAAAMRSDPEFAAELEARYPGITVGLQPGARGAYPRRSPNQYLTWHHDPKDEGVVELVRSDHHEAPGPVQQTLHPDRRGGMEEWGGGRKKRTSYDNQ